MKKVLLIRLDKIGDLVSTLCVDQIPALESGKVHWVIAKGLGFIPQAAVPPRKYLELSKTDWKKSLSELRQFIREFQPDVAVSFQSPWWVNFALWIEKVPRRSGVLSQWHSFLFLNHGLRQSRSRAIQHEADYNRDVLQYALGDRSSQATPILKLQSPENPEIFRRFSLRPKNYFIVHPGMAGSALNWPVPRYIELIKKLSHEHQVVLTGTATDEAWLSDIKKTFTDHPRVLNLQGQLNTSELLSLLQDARALVAPSTGVAHLGASLGIPVLGLYSPIRVQHPRRWAARGPHVHIFVPQKESPTCMEEISVEELLKVLGTL